MFQNVKSLIVSKSSCASQALGVPAVQGMDLTHSERTLDIRFAEPIIHTSAPRQVNHRCITPRFVSLWQVSLMNKPRAVELGFLQKHVRGRLHLYSYHKKTYISPTLHHNSKTPRSLHGRHWLSDYPYLVKARSLRFRNPSARVRLFVICDLARSGCEGWAQHRSWKLPFATSLPSLLFDPTHTLHSSHRY